MKKIFITLSMTLLLSANNLFAQEITSGKEIDLGLPSGTIWAAWNVGATSPEEYGGYYAWGETEEKSDYDWDTYKYYNAQTERYINIGSDISGTQYDVARQKWGASWRMPTKAEMYELTSKCTWTWCQYKGVNGCKVIGPNGNSIFLPAAGVHEETSLKFDGSFGYYWSATFLENNSTYSAWGTFFYNDGCSSDNYYCRRDFGLLIRPVK